MVLPSSSVSTEYCPNFTFYLSPPALKMAVAHFVIKHWFFLSCILDFSWQNRVFLGSYSITHYSQHSKSGFFMVPLLLYDFLCVFCSWRLKVCLYLFLMITVLLFPYHLFPMLLLSCNLYFSIYLFIHLFILLFNQYIYWALTVCQATYQEST